MNPFNLSISETKEWFKSVKKYTKKEITDYFKKMSDYALGFTEIQKHKTFLSIHKELLDKNKKLYPEEKKALREAIKKRVESQLKEKIKGDLTTFASTVENEYRYKEQMKDNRCFGLTYSDRRDRKVRVSHRLLHGTTAEKTSPIWSSIYPPNGFKCRCFVKCVSKKAFKKIKGIVNKISDLKQIKDKDNISILDLIPKDFQTLPNSSMDLIINTTVKYTENKNKDLSLRKLASDSLSKIYKKIGDMINYNYFKNLFKG
jgi:SPP1 gp7 family putative phage head morphogenesis protein